MEPTCKAQIIKSNVQQNLFVNKDLSKWSNFIIIITWKSQIQQVCPWTLKIKVLKNKNDRIVLGFFLNGKRNDKTKGILKNIFKKRSLDNQKRQAASSVLHICDPPFNWNFFFYFMYTDKVARRV